MLNIRRAWINQPSQLQPLHAYNGVSLLVHDTGEKVLDAWFVSGKTVSMRVPAHCLSFGSFAPNHDKD